MTKILNGKCCPKASSCGRSKEFPTLRALRNHIRSYHPNETIPAFGGARTFIEGHNAKTRNTEEYNIGGLFLNHETASPVTINNINPSMDYIDDDIMEYDDEPLPNTEILREELIGDPPISEEWQDNGSEEQTKELSENEMQIAKFAMDAMLSTRHYAIPVQIRYKTLQGIMDHVTKANNSLVCYNIQQALETVTIDVYKITDFPKGKEQEFLKIIHGPPILEFRNIHKVCEMIFSDPILWNVTRLSPSKVFRGNDRVYNDIYSGDFWIDLQEKLPPGIIALMIMLASDETLTSNNQRQKAYPMYLKLGNTMGQFRDKEQFGASKLLAYLPIISPGKRKDVNSWFPIAKRAIIHKCISLIFEPYSEDSCYPVLATYMADYPEMCLLAGTKQSIKTERACPCCETKTADFHLLCSYQDPEIFRTPQRMIDLYRHGRSLVRLRQKGLMEDMCKEYSINLSGFWKVKPIERFNIHRVLVADEMHQLMGVYSHLSFCCEKIILATTDEYDINIGTEIKNKIAERAASLPTYKHLRHFKNGIFVSDLKNPTNSELMDNMWIFLICIYDYLPEQAVLCVRKFIDFVIQATGREYKEFALKELDETLSDYYKYSAIFENESPSHMRFPKNHMLSKYSSDIMKHGSIMWYSTCHSERQHKRDCKRPAKRTNGHSNYTQQMARTIHYYDALQHEMTEDYEAIPERSMYIDPVQLPDPSYTLSSRLRGCHTLKSINNKKPFNFENLLKSFLDTYEEGHEATQYRRNMPSLNINEIEVYQTLNIIDYETDGQKVSETIRTHKVFYNRERMDYVIILYDDDVQVYGSVDMFFRIVYKGAILDLCLAQMYISIDQEHVTGLEIVRPALNSNYNGMFIAYVHQIDRGISIVKDFKYGKRSGSDLHYQYLVNTDTDRFSFINSKGRLKVFPDEMYQGWKTDICAHDNDDDDDDN
ncbi:hypothetical protein INT45_013821 [Circinella minor]|uniref:C2H2-type domain-containing protein n=1 Tax=Circinella minor TaxID=1195481 RepID=A0A8H7RS64_9FUNG|nr:hypothetical protein INT45_013821 [Circinella minor]